jgi:DNA-binding transcriptional LysR family regulator
MNPVARFLAALLLVFAPHFAPAQEAVPPEDARAVRAVIEEQLEAFRRDDAARAFSLATPGIRATFGDAETFMDMVRRSYAVVYRPSSVAFDAPLVIGGELVQPVRLTDSEGRAWLAIYPMQRQPDGSWRTNGCQLTRFAGTQT